MEKWKTHIKQYPELEKRWANIPEATNTLFCGQIDMYARQVAIEFADYYTQQSFRSDRIPLNTTEDYFNEFLSQKQF